MNLIQVSGSNANELLILGLGRSASFCSATYFFIYVYTWRDSQHAAPCGRHPHLSWPLLILCRESSV